MSRDAGDSINSRGMSEDGIDPSHHGHVAMDYSPRVTEDPDGGFDMYSPSNSASYNVSDPFYRDVYASSMMSANASMYAVGSIRHHSDQ